MIREYVEGIYLQAAGSWRRRIENDAAVAKDVATWWSLVEREWLGVRFGALAVWRADDQWLFEIQVDLGKVPATAVQVELYADPVGDAGPFHVVMERASIVSEAPADEVYRVMVSAARPAEHYTPRGRRVPSGGSRPS